MSLSFPDILTGSSGGLTGSYKVNGPYIPCRDQNLIVVADPRLSGSLKLVPKGVQLGYCSVHVTSYWATWKTGTAAPLLTGSRASPRISLLRQFITPLSPLVVTLPMSFRPSWQTRVFSRQSCLLIHERQPRLSCLCQRVANLLDLQDCRNPE